MSSRRRFIVVTLWMAAAAGCLTSVPQVPGNLVAVGGDSNVDLSWLPVSDDALKLYNVYTGTSEKSLQHTLTVARPKTQVTIPNLVNGATYYFAIDSENVLGQRSERSRIVSATPHLEADGTRPSIRGTVPQEGMDGVSLNSEIRIEFSKPMNIATVQVTLEPTLALGGPQWLSNNRILRFPNAQRFAKTTLYRITVEGEDMEGQELSFPKTFTFRTEDKDETPPLVRATSPFNGESDVPINAIIQIEFSEPMDSSRPSFPITFSPDFPWVEQWNPPHTLLMIIPTRRLAYGTTYGFSISGDAMDVSGNLLGASHSASFSTIGVPDRIPPFVTMVYPGPGQIASANPPPIVITFNEPMNTTLTEANIIVTSWVGTVVGTRSWNLERTQFTFQPTSPFISGERVGILLTQYRDLAGNSGYNFQSSFIVP